jgi:RNA-binding protein
VGKEGVSDAVLRQLDEQLAVHELVKVRIGAETPEDRFEAAARLGEPAGAQIAQVLGRTVLVYRRHPEKPRFEPLPAAERLERKPPEAKPPERRRPERPRAERSRPERSRPERKRPERKRPERSRPERTGPGRDRPERKAPKGKWTRREKPRKR